MEGERREEMCSIGNYKRSCIGSSWELASELTVRVL